MKNRFFRVILALTLLGIIAIPSLKAQSQSEPEDFRIWAQFYIKKKITKGFTAMLYGEIRTMENSTKLNQWMICPELLYTFNQYASVTAGYRYNMIMSDKYDKGFENCHRWFVGGTASYTYGNVVKLSLRELFEQLNYTDRPSDALNRQLNSLRSRLRLDFKTGTPFTPHIDAEHFLYLSGYGSFMAGETWMTRYTGGVSWKFAKEHTIDLFYRYVQYYVKPGIHVLGIFYTFSF